MSEPNLSKGFCGEVLSVHFWKLEQREKSGRGWLPASRVGGCGHLRPSQSAAGCHHKRTQGRIFWEEMAQHKIDQQVFGWPPSSQDDNFLNISDCLHSEGYYPFFICIRKKIYKKNDKTWYFFVKCLHLCCFSSFVPFLSFFVTYFVSCFFLCFTSIVLRTGSMEPPPISSTPILKFSSNLGKIGPKKMLWGVVLPPGTLFSPGASFSQWASL